MYRFTGALPPRKVLLLLSYVLFFYKRTIFSQCSIHLFFHKIFTLLPMLTESIDPRTRDTKSDETQLLPSRNCNDGGTAVWAHFRRDLSTGTSSPTGVRRFPELRVQPAALRDEVMSLQDKEQAVYCNGRKPKLTAPQLCGCWLSVYNTRWAHVALFPRDAEAREPTQRDAPAAAPWQRPPSVTQGPHVFL